MLLPDSPMNNLSIRYVVITPIRDEEAFIGATIECMLAQTIQPLEWLIVNDGSSDDTGNIIDAAAERYPWIRAVHRKDRGFRKSGGGIVDAFNEGYARVSHGDWDYIVKLDGDLTFAPDYFEQCFDKFHSAPQLGVGGGIIRHLRDGIEVSEKTPMFHVRGATKIYRRECWEGIGGLFPAAGWDTFDEIKANSLGWQSRTFPDLHLMHHRETGTADGRWGRLVKYGRANYICGYHPLFLLAKCLVRMFRKPYILGSVGILYGYVSGRLLKVPRPDDASAIAFLRDQQLRRLIGLSSIWR